MDLILKLSLLFDLEHVLAMITMMAIRIKRPKNPPTAPPTMAAIGRAEVGVGVGAVVGCCEI